MRKITPYLVSHLILITLFFPIFCYAGSPSTVSIIRNIDNNTITYEKYSSLGQKNIDIRNLKFNEDYFEKNNDILSKFYYNYDDVGLKKLLLENGLASIKDRTKASVEELSVEEKAKDEKVGMWSDVTLAMNKEQPISNGNGIWTLIWDDINRFWVWASGAGVVVLLIQWLSKRRNERKVRLIFVGSPSSGKTAIFTRLLIPGASEQSILETLPTTNKRETQGGNYRVGKFELVPIFQDVSGAKNDEIMSELFDSDILVIVLSPTKNNSVFSYNIEDKKYISEQLGVIKAQMGLIGSMKVKKPRRAILVLNKFDLFCGLTPNDDMGRSRKERFEKIFVDHVLYFKNVCEKNDIKHTVIVTSPVKNWGIDQIETNIKQLYA